MPDEQLDLDAIYARLASVTGEDDPDLDTWVVVPPPTEDGGVWAVAAGDYIGEGEPDLYIEVVANAPDELARFIKDAPKDIRALLDKVRRLLEHLVAAGEWCRELLAERDAARAEVKRLRELLDADLDVHVIEVREDGWTLKHPLSCRPNLFDCAVNRAGENLDGPPAPPGRQYMVDVDEDGELVILLDRDELLASGDFATHYGVPVTCVGEDGQYRVALGHVEPRRFLAACLRYDRERFQLTSREWDGDAFLLETVTHTRGLFRPTSEGGLYGEWGGDAQDHPAAVDITVIGVGS